MADKQLSITLRAKNQLAAGLAGAKATLSQFGTSILNVGKMIGGAMLAAGTAIAGVVAKAVSSYAEAQKAEQALRSSFKAFGESADVNTAAVVRMAEAIQNETGASADNLVQRAAKMRMLGVETSQLNAAMKATLALTAAGMDEEAAATAIAKAMNGNFKALEKVIPALRNAETESQKLAALNDWLAKGYQVQKDALNTVSGQWSLLKERLGDAWEAMGEVLSRDAGIQEAIKTTSGAVKGLTERFKNFVAEGGIVNLKATLLGFFENFSYSVNSGILVLQQMWSEFANATVVQYFATTVGSAVNAAVESIKYLANWVMEIGAILAEPFNHEFKVPDFGMVKAAYAELGTSIMGERVKEDTETQKLFAKEIVMREEHAKRLAEISEQQMRGLEQNLENQREASRQEAAAEVKIHEQKNLQIKASDQTVTDALTLSSRARADDESDNVDDVVGYHEKAADTIVSEWDRVRDAQEASAQSAALELAALRADRESGGSDSGAGASLGGFSVTGTADQLAALNKTLTAPHAWTNPALQYLPGMVAELRGIRQDNQRLMRWG